MAKVSKASEHYRDAASKAKRCGTCDHMLSGGECEVVQGKVEPDYVCDSWKGKSVSATMPHLAKVLALAREVPEHLASPGSGGYDRYDQDLAVDRVASRIPSPFSHAPGEEPSGRTRDYTRVERGREERVSGHIQSTLKAHLLAQHPGVYPYLQEGRDLEQLDEMHHTDHERHNMKPTHHYEPPDEIEHPADHIIGDASKGDVDEETGEVRSPRTEMIKHLASVHHAPGGEYAGMGMGGLRRLDSEYHEGHVFRPGERGSYR